MEVAASATAGAGAGAGVGGTCNRSEEPLAKLPPLREYLFAVGRAHHLLVVQEVQVARKRGLLHEREEEGTLIEQGRWILLLYTKKQYYRYKQG